MSKKMMYNCIYGLSTGTIICVIGIFRTFLPYIAMKPELYTFLLFIASILGSTVAVTMILFKNPSLTETATRFVSLFFSTGLCYALGAHLGIWSSLLSLLVDRTISASDNLSGLLLVTYLIVVVIASMLAIVIKGAITAVEKLMGHR